MATDSKDSFLVRNEFIIRRLHSLCGLIPVGAYMCVHLLVNASVLNGASSFQKNVYQIHSLGTILPVVEWVFIFIPIIFHAVFGFVIIGGGLQNTGNYPYKNNIRYMLQRVTGVLAALFIFWHVFQMHGWFHAEQWVTTVAKPLGGAQFEPYNAASTAGHALTPWYVVALYVVGVLACVYHLANGIWTMGITWGVWISPAGQRRASIGCGLFGVALAVLGMSSLFGMRAAADPQRIEATLQDEDAQFEQKSAAREVPVDSHKRLEPEQRQQLLDEIRGKTPTTKEAEDSPAADENEKEDSDE